MAATGALAGLAGCSQVPVVGDLMGGSAFYQDDLYAPGTVSDRNHYRFSAIRPADIANNEDEFEDETYDSFETYVEDQLFESHDLDIEDVETLTTVDNGGVTILSGSYNAEDVIGELEDNGFDDESETDSGHTVMLNAGDQTCTAVSDSSIVTMHSARALSAGEPVTVQTGTPAPSDGIAGTFDREVQDLRSMEYGESVRSQLDTNDPQSDGYRGFYEPVTFEGQEGDLVTISMESEPGDTYLMLEDPSGQRVARNDDYDSLNSRIEHTLQSSGEYTIIATSFSANDTFPYTLTLTGGAVNQDLRSISYDETKTGRLDDSDPTGQRGFYEPVTFDGSEGDVITISMSSPGDTYLKLQDPSGNVVTEDDDGGDSYNSRINQYALESDGEYTVIATSYSSGATFLYDLSVDLEFSPDQMVSGVESIVGVGSGNTDRYVDAMEAANELVNVLGDGTIVSGHTTEPIESDDPENGRIEGSVATGYSTTVNGSEADVTAAAVFEDEGDVDAGDVDDWVSEHSTLNEADDLSESEQGRVGVVTGVIDTDEL